MIELDCKRVAKIKHPADVIILADSRHKRAAEGDECPAVFINQQPLGGGCGWSGCDSADSCVSDRHNDGANLAFVDGHAKWMKKSALDGGFPMFYKDQP
jgi:prepilin-type processing-associated H-X9-DG protein